LIDQAATRTKGAPSFGRGWIYLLLALGLGLSLVPVAIAPQHVNRVRVFADTGHRVAGRFLETWELPGSYAESVLLNGFPISDVYAEVNPVDGKTYQVQWFQRARYEAHPEEAPPHDVQLGLLGVEATRARQGEPAFAKVPRPAADPAVYWFPETEHTLRGPFLDFWLKHLAVGQMGFPISEELTEPDPQAPAAPRRVQYFQRARLELGADGTVTRGLLGWELYQAAGRPTGPAPTP
jgi:hypothetical protein